MVRISSIINVLSIFLKIFLAIMIFTAIYSLLPPHVGIAIGSAEYGISEDLNLYVGGTLIINNTGFYSFEDLNITFMLKNLYENETFGQSFQTLGNVPPTPSPQYKSFNLRIPLSQIFSHKQLIVNDTTVFLFLELEGKYALGLIPFSITVKEPFEWEAPLDQLLVSLAVNDYNETHKSVVISYDFYSSAYYAYPLNITYYYVEDSKEVYVDTISLFVTHDSHISDHTPSFLVPKNSTVKVVFSSEIGFTYEVLRRLAG